MEKITLAKEVYKALDLCRSQEKDRYMLSGLHLGEDYVEATDGRILLRVRISKHGIKEGAYKVVGVNKTQVKGFVDLVLETIDGEYPDTERVIPADGKASDQLVLTIQEEKKETLSLSSAVLKLYQHTGNAYGYHLLRCMGVMNETWAIGKADKDKPIKATSKDSGSIAVVLPFQLG